MLEGYWGYTMVQSRGGRRAIYAFCCVGVFSNGAQEHIPKRCRKQTLGQGIKLIKAYQE